jgi:hypothetical protein
MAGEGPGEYAGANFAGHAWHQINFHSEQPAVR